jgi:serine/threonine-protein kinase
VIAPDVFRPEQVIAGRYRLRHQIARGGMAEVWEAGDDVLGRSVAVKVLLPEFAADPTFIERFRREAIAAARLAHPNVVATFDTGVDGDMAFIVMELVDGRTLRDVLVERGPLPPQEAVSIAAQAADALHYAHEAGIVHRDVKPANILLCPDGRVKVAALAMPKSALSDASFGPSSTDWDLTGTGMVVGTAKYLSPEQFEGKPVDRRSDVYALGVVLYEMLCGRPPFTGGSDMAIGIQHVERKPLSPRQVRAGIPKPLETVVLRAMAKSPAARYPTAAALQSALLSVDLGSDDAVPMVVREDTPPRGVPQTFAQSQRSWLVPTVLIVVVAVTLGIVGMIFARSDAGHRLLGDTPGLGSGSGGAAVAISSVTSFDPTADGVEHEDEVGNLVDGDVSTTWRTERYAGPDFGGLKPGVGFVLALDAPVKLGKLELLGTSKGFDAEVVVANAAPDNRAAWGDAVATKKGVGTEATFDLDGRSGTAVLVWITNPTDTVASVGEVKLTAA